MKINIIFHSLFGHIYQMAEDVAEGAREVEGSDVNIYQVEETLSDEILEKKRALESKKSFSHIPTATLDTLKEADGLIFGTPTRFGMMTAQMRTLFDATGELWVNGDLIGKVGSVFTSSATQHGGQESTILRQMTIDEITGGSPYGASTIASPDGSRQPSENELNIAHFQGKRVAEITKKLVE
ncbi:NAD(P)H:quinone oxidoreductase [Methanohalobium sp.]|uniref:NAD(P)H:quinone oxidoreductase n=1 Tax=Methanohalobium sp. TaxID=2837493 RepID=UPI0025D6F341|nr:NAD(P)H:quinone oxidoreductase [Methanohalobium sp.]